MAYRAEEEVELEALFPVFLLPLTSPVSPIHEVSHMHHLGHQMILVLPRHGAVRFSVPVQEGPGLSLDLQSFCCVMV